MVLLFYKYVGVPDAEEARRWHEATCERLSLVGKVRVAAEGINGTLSGTAEAIEQYVHSVLARPDAVGRAMQLADFKVRSRSGPGM